MAVVSMACGGGDPRGAASTDASRTDRCVLRLHGKGGDGAPPRVDDEGVLELAPAGNADAWGGHEWRYFPDERYVEALGVLDGAVTAAGCTSVVVDGFSNGGAFAAKLYCRGETLSGRVVGVVVDDPVPDAATTGCAPAPRVQAVLYWTRALEGLAAVGTECAQVDWTCQGDTVVGIAAFAAAAGLPVDPSPFTEHEWFRDAPEIERWLAPAP